MNSDEFILWLNEFLSSHNELDLDESKTEILKNKLRTVFTKVTPVLYENPTNFNVFTLSGAIPLPELRVEYRRIDITC